MLKSLPSTKTEDIAHIIVVQFTVLVEESGRIKYVWAVVPLRIISNSPVIIIQKSFAYEYIKFKLPYISDYCNACHY